MATEVLAVAEEEEQDEEADVLVAVALLLGRVLDVILGTGAGVGGSQWCPQSEQQEVEELLTGLQHQP